MNTGLRSDDRLEPPRSREAARLYLVVFLLFAVLYGATAQRGPAWQDSGILQWRVFTFDLAGSEEEGLARAHPLFILLGKAFSVLVPWGPVAWRINLLSAVCGALAVANIAWLARRMVPQRAGAAWLAAGIFGLSHTAWWLSTISQSRMLQAAAFTFELNVLVSMVRRPRASKAGLLGLISGLGWSAHGLALVALPAYVLVVLHLCADRRMRWKGAAFFPLGWAVGALPMIYILFQRAATTGWPEAVHSALFGGTWQGTVTGVALRPICIGAVFVLYSLPNLALPLAGLSLWRLGRRVAGPLVGAFGYLTLAYFIFALRFDVPDHFMFFLPFYAMAAVLAALEAGAGERSSRDRRLAWAVASLAIGPLLYLLTPGIVHAVHPHMPWREDLAGRDAARYWLTPWKSGEDSAGEFARAALRQAPPGGYIVADGTSLYPLKWVQSVEGIGPEVHLLSNDVDRQGTPPVPPGTANVFTVTDHPEYLSSRLVRMARFVKDDPNGPLFRVEWETQDSQEPSRIEPMPETPAAAPAAPGPAAGEPAAAK